MIRKAISTLFLLSSALPASAQSDLYQIEVVDMNGNKTTLEDYKGKVLLIVNVASKCGYTYQYDLLQELYETYVERGLVVLGFPSNDFLGQEPGSNEEIEEFCRLNYGVTFPMFEKIAVKGRKIHPLYKHLTSRETNPGSYGRITWNFNKFLVGPTGEIVNRFKSKEEPNSPEIIAAVEAALAALD